MHVVSFSSLDAQVGVLLPLKKKCGLISAYKYKARKRTSEFELRAKPMILQVMYTMYDQVVRLSKAATSVPNSHASMRL